MSPQPLTSGPTVHVVAWSARDALAFVDGVRVRIRRRSRTVGWLCDEHGSANTPALCEHTRALAQTPADPTKNRRAQYLARLNHERNPR